MKNSIAVVGSGLVGAVLAMSLKDRGFDVTVYDKSEDIRKVDFSGRSINLALSERGWKMLRKIGLEDSIREMAIPMFQRAIHAKDGKINYQPYGINGESIWAVSRGDLNKKLVDLAEERGVKFAFQTPVWGVDLERGVLFSAAKESDQWDEIKHNLIFGADGAYSRVRLQMQKHSQFEYQQSYLTIGYKELIIPADVEGKHRLDKNSFHIWPRKDFMLIALANTDGSFTCTLFMPFEGEVSFNAIQNISDLNVFFDIYFPDAKTMMPDLEKLYFRNPVNSLVTMKCFPWIYGDKAALIGDAAHAVVPFYGQGLNAGLEDIDVLTRIFDRVENKDWKKILQEYQDIRKPNGDAIAELSYRNFQEMSELTADSMFLLRKKIETNFSKKYPELWLPLYDRVTFSEGTYLEALKIGDIQKEIMDEVMQIDRIEHLWNSPEIEEIMKRAIQCACKET